MSRTADYVIQGFHYQLNKALLEILRPHDDAIIMIEGIVEDVEIKLEDKIQAMYDYDQSNWEAAKSSIGDLMKVSGQAFVNYFKTYGNTVKSLVDANQDGIMYNSFIPQQQEDQDAARSNLRFKGDVPMHWYKSSLFWDIVFPSFLSVRFYRA